MSDDSFKHISVGLNQMLVNLRRKMDENKASSKVGKPPPKLGPEALAATFGKMPQADESDAA